MRKTSRSRQFPWSWTSMQSLANREVLVGSSGTPRCWQISAASSGWADPEKTAMSRTGITLEAYGRTLSSDQGHRARGPGRSVVEGGRRRARPVAGGPVLQIRQHPVQVGQEQVGQV